MLIPLFLVLWLITGLAGIATGGRFLHNLQYLSSDTAVSLEKKCTGFFTGAPTFTATVGLLGGSSPTKLPCLRVVG